MPPAPPAPVPSKLLTDILGAVGDEVANISTLNTQLGALAQLGASLVALETLISPLPPVPAISNALTACSATVSDILSEKKSLTMLGQTLSSLYVVQAAIGSPPAVWTPLVVSAALQATLDDAIAGIIVTARQIVNARPDVAAVMADLEAMKGLQGGPADATSYHDFNVLQIAFKSVWLHAFSGDVTASIEALYNSVVTIAPKSTVSLPSTDSTITDVNSLNQLLTDLQQVVASTPTSTYVPAPVSSTSGNGKGSTVTTLPIVVSAPASLAPPPDDIASLENLITELGTALAEPYAFDVFVADSYNYGILTTYRQRWEPGAYQAGDLAATIPLTPGETRKYSKKVNTKTQRAVKALDKSQADRSSSSDTTNRAEADIINLVHSATNFQLTANGSFNIGIGSLSSTSQFGGNQSSDVTTTTKDFHEATLKAANQYRLEHSLEIDTTISSEMETSEMSEISNPNNEITVTYLFYELQRLYTIQEFLYRVRPVILVALDVPSPEEIDEAWLIQYNWILARVLLDDSFKSALTYLSTGYAGDDVSLGVLQATWQAQVELNQKLESEVSLELTIRDSLRNGIVQQTFDKSVYESLEVPAWAKALTGGAAGMFDPASTDAAKLKARIAAGKSQLTYVEDALSDAQEKLRQSAATLESLTQSYSKALQEKFNRDVSIDQLRIHVKQNILYYMQAIWSTQDADQLFFHLYNRPVICPDPAKDCQIVGKPINFRNATSIQVSAICAPAVTDASDSHALSDIADLDNPLGFKGNYIIFPLVDYCYLTDFMISQFLADYLAQLDTDNSATFDPATFESMWINADAATRTTLEASLKTYLTETRYSSDTIIVPTGQLFVEALPGTHPVLEDFKLAHREIDVDVARIAASKARLENYRLAMRLDGTAASTARLDDPDVDRKIVVESDAAVTVETGA